jgi:hypothetical protein
VNVHVEIFGDFVNSEQPFRGGLIFFISLATAKASGKSAVHGCQAHSMKGDFSAGDRLGDRQDQPTFDCGIAVDRELQKLNLGKNDRVAVHGAELTFVTSILPDFIAF